MNKKKPTDEQKVIFYNVHKEKHNLLIEARAGCGKTSTIVAALTLIPKELNTIFLAFNKHIQEELKEKLPEHVRCKTMHGLGLAAILRKYGNDVKVDEFKVDKILKKKSKIWKLKNEFKFEGEIVLYLNELKKLVDLCRLTLTLDKKFIEFLAKKYDIKYYEPKDIKRVLSVLEVIMNDKKTIDFTDMVFLPAVDPKIWLFPQDYVIVDECFPHNQYISTEIGKKKIGHLAKMYEKGEKLPMVETFNEQTGFFEKKNIVKVWCNGERDIYEVIVGGKRKIKSTKNHKFLTLDGWKRLDDLVIGDAILSNYVDQPYHRILNKIQEDIFVGSILGDGSLHNLSKNISRIKVTHGEEQKEYVKWKASFFNSNVKLVENNGFAKKNAYTFISKGYYFDDKYKDVKKVIDNITLKSLAIAWMDDGTISNKYNSSRLYSCAESKELSQYLSHKIEKMWKVKSIVRNGKSSSTGMQYYWLYFNKENTEKLSSIISEFIHPSMKYKLCSKHRKNIDLNNWLENENKYGCMVVTKHAKFIKKDLVYDMEVEDNHNFIITSSSYNKNSFAKEYGLIAHNCQDLNRAQQKMVEKMIKRDKKTKQVVGRLISIGDPHQCQPKGTKILMYDGTEKNIEDVVVGDRVVSYDKSGRAAFLGYYKNHRWGAKSMKNHAPVVEEISKHRDIDNNLIVVESNGNKSKYTANHRCFVRFRPDKIKGHALYLMEKDGYYRIGITPLWSKNWENSVTARAKGEKADKFWVLNIYEDKHDAYIEEQYNSLIFGIPQLRFVDNKTGLFNQEKIDKFYDRFDKVSMNNGAIQLLNKFGRYVAYPFWKKGQKNYISKKHLFEIKACNIIGDYMQMIHFDEKNIIRRTHGKGKPTNNLIKVKYYNIDKHYNEEYNDYVYSLKIGKWENYVADGMLTHNSIYSFAGSDSNSFDWFRKYPNTKILPLTKTFRCGEEIVKEAQKIVPDIKPMDGAHTGLVTEGDVVNDPIEGDFVLCRKTAPLVSLFFQYLLRGEKATIKGRDIGVSLIEMIKGHKTIGQLLAYWANEQNSLMNKLKKQGILNFEEHSGYVSLKDKIDTISFLSKLSKNITDLIDKIKIIFSDELSGIILSTVHKSKGLEADRVFIARPELLPMPAKKAWQAEQEKNLKYVALTRARKELIFDYDWNDEKEK